MTDHVGVQAADLRDGSEIILRHGEAISAVVDFLGAKERIYAFVGGEPVFPFPQIVDAADDIIVSVGGFCAPQILLDAAVNGDFVPIFFLQPGDLGSVFFDPLLRDAVGGVKIRVGVGGDTDAGHTPLDGGQHHFLGGIFSVAETGVRVKIPADHFVIFSCLIL